MFFRFALSFAALLLGLAAGPATARSFDLPKVGYSAERMIKSGDRWQAMQVHYSPGMERMDLEGSAAAGNVMIVRYDKALTWILIPKLHAYLELPGKIGDDIVATVQSLDLQPVGRERVKDIATTKYKVDGEIKGFMWLGRNDIPVQIDGDLTVGKNSKPVPTHFEQTNIQVAAQDPALFEVPDGLVRIKLKDARWLGLMQQFLGGQQE
jgi:hypothetical protein